jgi:carbon-monoxide dehydrogenase large subunit
MRAEDGRTGPPWVGRPIRRLEDPRHLRGTATFVDDLRPAGLRHAVFVRSPHAAARMAGVDATRALACEGVHAVLTVADLGELRPWRPQLHRDGFRAVDIPPLAEDAVRHVGEPVAIVVADTPHAAEDGAELVDVDYEPLDAVASLDAALAEDAPRVHEALDANLLLDEQFAEDPATEEALAAAELTVQASFESGRLTALPLEGRACLAAWEAGTERLVLHTSTQVPHIVRTTVAELLAIPEHRVRVVAPDVGGGFGQKCVVAREEVALCAAARVLRSSLKWVEDRQESLSSGFQGHQQRLDVRAGFEADGRLAALDVVVLADAGAYHCHPFTAGVEALMAATEMPGPYRVGHYRARARSVCTNKPPMAPYRGVARPQMILAMERLLEKAARGLGLEVDEVRRRNLIPPGAFPHRQPTGLEIDEGSYIEALDRCASALGLGAFRARQRAARAEGRLLGIGLSCYAERSGYGTSAFSPRRMTVTPGYDTAIVRMDPSGTVSVAVGTCGHGQGHQTTLAQVAADQLGVDPRDVEVRQGDTDTTPYGWGTFASRSMVIGGGATRQAAAALADRVRRLAAHLLEAAPEDLELRDGRAVVRGSGDRGVDLRDVGRLAHLEVHRLPEGERPGLEEIATYDPPGTFSNACHGAIVEVDPETGAVSIERYLVVEDCGVMVNPMIVEGQIRGGVAQGIAAALYEELAYAEDGQLLSASLIDYLVPTAQEIPPIEIQHLETPSAYSETGAKGLGEGGTMGAPACIACAVADAVAHLGVEVDRIPVTPERLLGALRDAERSPA